MSSKFGDCTVTNFAQNGHTVLVCALSVDLITVNIVLCFVFIALFYAIWPHGHKNEIKVYFSTSSQPNRFTDEK